MSNYTPPPFNTVVTLLTPVITEVRGVDVKTYEEVDKLHCSFKTYGGTETVSNDLLVVEDTVTIITWFRPDITSDSAIKLGNKIYEVIGEPENLDMRNQYLKFKVRAVKGGA